MSSTQTLLLVGVVLIPFIVAVFIMLDIAETNNENTDEPDASGIKNIHQNFEQEHQLTEACNRVREQTPTIRAKDAKLEQAVASGNTNLFKLDGDNTTLYSEELSNEDIALAQVLNCSTIAYPVTGHIALFEPDNIELITTVREQGLKTQIESVIEDEFTDEQLAEYKSYAEPSAYGELTPIMYILVNSQHGNFVEYSKPI